MSTVFHRLHRLRKLEERTAQVALADAQALREERQQEVAAIVDAVERSHAAANDPALWATHHRFVLDQEISRRAASHRLDHAHARVSQCHAEVVRRATDARTVELLAEAAQERADQEARLAEQRAFDEVGSQRWLRRAS